MSTRKEDRFPLLFMVNLSDRPEKPPYLEPRLSERDLNVSRGAATVMSRWPHHIHTTSRLAFMATVVVMCLSLFIVALVFYTSGRGFRIDGDGLYARGRLAPCEQDGTFHKGAEVETLVNFMAPLSRAWEFFADEEKVFFVMSQGDELTPDKLCAIQSAAITNPNSTVYLLILVDNPKIEAGNKRAELAAEEAAFNKSIKVVNVDVVRYLSNTPLQELWKENKSMRELAVKLVTLWRFGGVALDLGVITLKEVKLTRRKTKNTCMDPEGHVLSTHYPCHAFLFQAMRTLAKLNEEGLLLDRSANYNTRFVLTATREAFCRKPHCRNGAGFYRKCLGLKILGEDVVCHDEHRPKRSGCTWATFSKYDATKKYFQDICGFFAAVPKKQ